MDSVDGGDGDDLLIVDYTAETAAIQTSGASFSDFVNTQITFDGIERIDFRGGSGADIITLGGGDDRFAGGAGNDAAFGGAGADRLVGGAGQRHAGRRVGK